MHVPGFNIYILIPCSHERARYVQNYMSLTAFIQTLSDWPSLLVTAVLRGTVQYGMARFTQCVTKIQVCIIHTHTYNHTQHIRIFNDMSTMS